MGTCVLDVVELCGEMLGVTLPTDALRGFVISIWWYVSSYPPYDLMLMRLIWSGVHVGSS